MSIFSHPALGRFLPSRENAAVIGLAVLLYLEHLIYGANRSDLSLFFAIVHLVLLLAVLATSQGRRVLTATPLLWLAIPFALVLAEAAFSAAPTGGRFGHPLWSFVDPSGGPISLDPAATRLEMVKLMGLAAMFLLAVVVGARRERAETFVRALSYIGGVYAAWAFLSWTVNPREIFGVTRAFGGGERLSASFLSSNSAATLFACQTLLQICLVLRAVRRVSGPLFSRRSLAEMKDLPVNLILLFMSASCLILTASRGGVLACAAATALALACFALVRSNRRSASGGVAVVAGVVAFAGLTLLLVSGNTLLHRFGENNPISDSRMLIFAGYWRSVMASPWWGYGLGAFHAFNFQSMSADNAVALGNLGAAHDVYLQWMLQAGLLGAVPMMACVILILAAVARGFKRRSSQQAVLIFSLAASAVFAVHGSIDYALEEPSLAAYWSALLGLGYGVAYRA